MSNMIIDNFFKKPSKKKAIFEILNTEYCDLLHDLMMGDDFEEIVEENPMKSERVNELKQYLKKCNIDTYMAPAIYNYTVNSDDMLSVKRKDKTIDDLQEKVYASIRAGWSTSYPKYYVDDLMNTVQDFFETFSFKGKTQKQMNLEVSQFAKSLGISNSAPLTYLAYELCKVDKIKENIPILDYALESHEIKIVNNDKNKKDLFEEKDIVLYRAVRNSNGFKKACGGKLEDMVGQYLVNNFPTSTSKTYNQSFATRPQYDIVFVIKVPKGSRGIDIEALSNFGKKEGEVLLAKNRFLIEKVEYKEDFRGNMKYFVDVTLDQRELLRDIAMVEKASENNGVAIFNKEDMDSLGDFDDI